MRVLVIGLGSMGKRRVRNMQAIGGFDICGFDPRADRREESQAKYGIQTFSSFEEAVAEPFGAFVISVAPDKHHIYMKEAIRRSTSFFVEASVVDTDMEVIIRDASAAGIVAAPSSTMYFHPAIRKITEMVRDGILGTLSSVMYHSGQYLPDWHTYEKVSDFYVSNKATGGAREIVPFELTWLVQTFGWPHNVSGVYRKTIQIDGAPDIDDVYMGIFDYKNFMLNLTVDVVSRNATRRLLINGGDAQLRWDWNDQFISIYKNGEETRVAFEMIGAAEGYHKNITEQMYIDEMQAFFNAVVNKRSPFVNDLTSDHRVLKLLYALEESADSGRMVTLA